MSNSKVTTMDSILAETDQIMQVKAAKFTGRKSAMTGTDPDSLPGAEMDQPIPEGSESSDPTVADGTMGPASARTTDGAGDDSLVTRGQGMEAEQAAETPVKKPLITADANAEAPQEDSGSKTAAMANDLLQHIKGWQGKQASAKQALVTPASVPGTAGEGVEKTNTQPPTPEREKHTIPGGESGTGGDGSACDNKTDTGTDMKSAARFDMELTQDVLAKMAAIILSYDEGVEFASDMLEKFGGDVLAQEVMGTLEAQNIAAEKQAAAEAGRSDGQAAVNAYIYEQGRKSAASDCDSAPAKSDNLAPPFKKKDAPKDEPMDEEKDAAVNPQALWKLGQELAESSVGDIMGALPDETGAPVGGEEQEASVEDVAAALDVLVSEGEIQPEEAAEVLEYVASAGGEGGEMGGLGEEAGVGADIPDGAMAEMAAPPEDVAPAPEDAGALPPPPPPEGGEEEEAVAPAEGEEEQAVA